MTTTTASLLDRIIRELRAAAPRLAKMSAAAKAEMAQECLLGVMSVADEWVAAACEAKRIDPESPLAAEEIGAGPLATVRYLRLLITALDDTQNHGRPLLPARPRLAQTGQVVAPVFPTRSGLFDRLLFWGFSGSVWMRPEVTLENLNQHTAGAFRRPTAEASVCLVLGAGNVSSIAATDALTKVFQEGRAVLLKMNPVNAYLGSIFERAFGRLVREGFLRMAYGGADVGRLAAYDEHVDAVHVTGSTPTHDAIVWEADPDERRRRREANDPKLKKTITSELGNITPWIVVPGQYSKRQLAFQAENLAASIVNNASFNCVATKMIVTARSWPQREEFLRRVRECLVRTPRRYAYYPGAGERFRQFGGEVSDRDEHSAGGDDSGSNADDYLPWTLRENVNPEEQELLFERESFVCVVGETSIDADDADAFVNAVGAFANDRLWGTLAAAVIVPNGYRREAAAGEARLQRLIAELRYGTVCINQWPGLAFAMMCCPWGGYPGGTLHDPKSGVGWVHNTFLLDAAEKTVVEGPLIVWPKPLWFPSHRTAHTLSRKVVDLYARPRWWKLLGITASALRG